MVATLSASVEGPMSNKSTPELTASITRDHSTVPEHAADSMQGCDCLGAEGRRGLRAGQPRLDRHKVDQNIHTEVPCRIYEAAAHSSAISKCILPTRMQ